MQLGIYFPSTEVPLTGATLREFTRAVDAMGYDYVVTADHVLGTPHEGREPKLWGPYTEHDTFLDPFVLFSHMAAYSDRLEFATSIMVLPQRQTALVAKQAADLAVLTDNRFRLAVGVGWNHVEFAALGQHFSRRGARTDEQIAMLRRLWTEELVSGTVGDEVFDRAGINPRPTVPVPIWLGGYAEVALRRGAQVGDGFSFGGLVEEAAPMQRRVQELLHEYGRDRSIARLGAGDGVAAADGRPGARRRWPCNRPSFLDGMADGYAQWGELGRAYLAVTTYWMELGDLANHLAYAEQAIAPASAPDRRLNTFLYRSVQ
ncbi:MAG: TIGR03619 family F420-dependent LLM class oxidoreductase [Acidimicrobiia bacterium]